MTKPGQVTMKKSNPSVSVVFSFFNEEDNIPELLRRCRQTLRAEQESGNISKYELIFVNDDSTDASERMLTEEAQREGDIKLVNMSRNFGNSSCIIAGFEHSRGDLVFYMDADLQDPPELMAKMLAAWRADDEVEVVNTVRLSRAGESKIKLAITRLGYDILARTSSIRFIREAGDFKLLSRKVVDHMLDMPESFPFTRGLVYYVGFKQENVYYHRESRHAGESKFFVLGPRVIHNFLFSALISFSSAPLVLSLLIGTVAALIGVSVMTYSIIQYFVVDGVTSGWTSLIAAVLFMGSAQLITTGINGFYINSIFIETKRRPRYIVKSTVGGPLDAPKAAEAAVPAKDGL
ncbi:glycosyltransferase family 2 protein [Paramagnetospirillum magneticum]|uniref:Glycosyltransferase n=1 Tax=Paramagnetospirillum magneticum (strain ATCC 700264 / AMB-1) TaxID=342108 RepID=Q2W8D9_PARM1|nr:glycosyltransferase family 2 protein [Paramagnetospirillum magneticum]BAE49886.1 Glycosyltransferase [Paramagnetospirillum magneticum AMB-1]